MASQLPAVKNAALTFYVSLVSQANTKVLQGNPTLAAGDVQVSTDGGAFGNLATLPAVTPAAGKAVKVDLSAAEMNGDNVVVVFSDAAGAEWCDLEVSIQTAARPFDAIPTGIENADALLDRNMATGADSGTETVRTVRQALRHLRNKWDIVAGLLTVRKEDDNAVSWTSTVTADGAAQPITGSDPTST